MSRHGYSDEGGNFGAWRGVIASATRGKRGQAFFRALVAALDAMPEKKLIRSELETREGANAMKKSKAQLRARAVELRSLRCAVIRALAYGYSSSCQLSQPVQAELCGLQLAIERLKRS